MNDFHFAITIRMLSLFKVVLEYINFYLCKGISCERTSFLLQITNCYKLDTQEALNNKKNNLPDDCIPLYVCQ